jgi:hypothetical protein
MNCPNELPNELHYPEMQTAGVACALPADKGK